MGWAKGVLSVDVSPRLWLLRRGLFILGGWVIWRGFLGEKEEFHSRAVIFEEMRLLV